MKLVKSIRRFVKRIATFIDKNIVVPITKLVLFITSKFDKNGRVFENLLSKNNTLLYLSLFIAVVILLLIVYDIGEGISVVKGLKNQQGGLINENGRTKQFFKDDYIRSRTGAEDS